jgi:glucuronate isomerase
VNSFGFQTNRLRLVERLSGRISELPTIDAHTHLVGGKLGARGLHDVLLYHMAISDLYAAGCPSGARLTQYPGWPSDEEAHSRIREAVHYLRYVRNTSSSWGVRIILRDLYGIEDEVTVDNWESIDREIRARADDRSWHREVADRANILRFGTEIARREDGCDDDVLSYSLEWAFFTRCQWGEFDTALYELERCWGRTPESPTPIGAGGRPATEKAIHTLDDVHEAMEWYAGHIPVDRIVSIATHISTDIDLRLITDGEMAGALLRRESAGTVERDIYASYINEAFLTALERYADRLVFQFSVGAEPLPHETGSRLSQNTVAQLAEMISRHPKIRFQCFLSSRHANQSLCTLCRELPNLSLAGYWWHNFFPSAMRQVMEERLDMLPVNKQIGFFSDAYCVEWAYAKSVIVKQELARVLAQKVECGQYDEETAVGIAGEILFDTPKSLLGIAE